MKTGLKLAALGLLAALSLNLGGCAAVGGALVKGALSSDKTKGQLTEEDRAALRGAEAAAPNAPINTPVTWTSAKTGHSGSITAVREWKEGTKKAAKTCREYLNKADLGDGEKETRGIACRGADGKWQIQS